MKQEDISILKGISPLWEDGIKLEDFEFLCEEDFEKTVLPWLRENTTPSRDNKMSRRSLHYDGVVYDDGHYTLDEYYIKMINDTLSEIRRGKTAYIFTLAQVRDVLRYESEANFFLSDGIYYVSLPLGRRMYN